ncbi:hypothetical protein EDB84DRAFT_918140 [Lactarius hengduanensis]|nr:hypothetical protein EDB84DRAFT_918140 [Lactarius hengduanensis]
MFISVVATSSIVVVSLQFLQPDCPLLVPLTCPADLTLRPRSPSLPCQRGHAQPSPAPPNLFTGPGGQLKNARRGRPTPSKTSSTAPCAVDLTTTSTASEQIARTTTPLVTSPMGPSPCSLAFAGTPIKVQLGLPIGLR